MSKPKSWVDGFFDRRYVVFDQLRHRNSEEDLSFFLELYKRHSVGRSIPRCVDLCCGYGRILIPLLRRLENRSIGIDQSISMLALLRGGGGLKRGYVLQADLRKECLRCGCDLALLVGTSFGYYGESNGDSAILVAARRMLRTGGLLILDQLESPESQEIVEKVGGTVFRLSGKYDEKDRLFWGDYSYELPDSHELLQRCFEVNLYSLRIFQVMLEECDFEFVTAYGDFSGGNFVEGHSDRLILVARACE